MLESIFGGDLNGQYMYDTDWEDYPEGGAKTSGGGVGATVIGKFARETGKAILYDFWGRNKKTGEFESATQKWLPLSYVRNGTVPKDLREHMSRDFVFVSVPSWLFNKVEWPKTHIFQYSLSIEKEIKKWTQAK